MTITGLDIVLALILVMIVVLIFVDRRSFHEPTVDDRDEEGVGR